MTTHDRNVAADVLRQAAWLRGYAPELTDHLLAEGRLVRRAVGEWAQAEGDDRGGLFVVVTGLLHSYFAADVDREVMIGLVGPGAMLGHATRFSGGPRLVTAVCMKPSLLLELSEAALDRVAEHRPELWRAIADFTYANMRGVLRMAADLISLAPRQRLAARLLAAAEAQGSTEIWLSQELLGEMTGLTRKTVNHHLAALERAGLVETGYGRICLCDVEGLRRVAES
ncbi:Crp/Fnr family transcriptional regulator [Novosphingobium arvoryzae]|uniref:Crp/Fnr family transcriptional regulator n=1 Tax=Novosphingobium arvoryzae TaxID=1256514 RepID=UPI0035B497BD